MARSRIVATVSLIIATLSAAAMCASARLNGKNVSIAILGHYWRNSEYFPYTPCRTTLLIENGIDEELTIDDVRISNVTLFEIVFADEDTDVVSVAVDSSYPTVNASRRQIFYSYLSLLQPGSKFSSHQYLRFDVYGNFSSVRAKFPTLREDKTLDVRNADGLFFCVHKPFRYKFFKASEQLSATMSRYPPPAIESLSLFTLGNYTFGVVAVVDKGARIADIYLESVSQRELVADRNGDVEQIRIFANIATGERVKYAVFRMRHSFGVNWREKSAVIIRLRLVDVENGGDGGGNGNGDGNGNGNGNGNGRNHGGEITFLDDLLVSPTNAIYRNKSIPYYRLPSASSRATLGSFTVSFDDARGLFLASYPGVLGTVNVSRYEKALSRDAADNVYKITDTDAKNNGYYSVDYCFFLRNSLACSLSKNRKQFVPSFGYRPQITFNTTMFSSEITFESNRGFQIGQRSVPKSGRYLSKTKAKMLHTNFNGDLVFGYDCPLLSQNLYQVLNSTGDNIPYYALGVKSSDADADVSALAKQEGRFILDLKKPEDCDMACASDLYVTCHNTF